MRSCVFYRKHLYETETKSNSFIAYLISSSGLEYWRTIVRGIFTKDVKAKTSPSVKAGAFCRLGGARFDRSQVANACHVYSVGQPGPVWWPGVQAKVQVVSAEGSGCCKDCCNWSRRSVGGLRRRRLSEVAIANGNVWQRLARLELRMMIIMLVLSFEFKPIPEKYASFRAEEVINRGPATTYIRPVLRA